MNHEVERQGHEEANESLTTPEITGSESEESAQTGVESQSQDAESDEIPDAPQGLTSTVNWKGQDVTVSMDFLTLFSSSDAQDNLSFRVQDKLGYGVAIEDRAERPEIMQKLLVAEPSLQLVQEYWELYSELRRSDSPEEKRTIGEKMKLLREQAGFKGELPNGRFDPVRVAFGQPAWGESEQ